jgi:hypothetical protein
MLISSWLLGGRHRKPKEGEYAKTAEARFHDRLLMRTYYIIELARRKNPHMVVIIENPSAAMKHMPIMQRMVEAFNLTEVHVDYCAFGRHDKKPTDLWTNVSTNSSFYYG